MKQSLTPESILCGHILCILLKLPCTKISCTEERTHASSLVTSATSILTNKCPPFSCQPWFNFLQFSPSTTPPGSSGINASVSLRGLTGSPFGASEQRIWVAVCVAFPTSIYPFSQSLHPVVSLNSLTHFRFFSFHLARSACSELALHSSVLVSSDHRLLLLRAFVHTRFSSWANSLHVSPLGLTHCTFLLLG